MKGLSPLPLRLLQPQTTPTEERLLRLASPSLFGAELLPSQEWGPFYFFLFLFCCTCAVCRQTIARRGRCYTVISTQCTSSLAITWWDKSPINLLSLVIDHTRAHTHAQLAAGVWFRMWATAVFRTLYASTTMS